MLVKIKRQKGMGAEPYWQTFSYDGERNVTVSAVLDYLNGQENLVDIDGMPAPHIRWACSCMQNICGACAMVINGRPSLACNTFLRDLDDKILILEPLSKFPTAIDLTVDRSIIQENLKRAEVFLGEYESASVKDRKKNGKQQYSVAKCMKCGLCLEVCPNYKKGENFFGALFANESYLLHSQSKDRKKTLKDNYKEHFSAGCSKSLSCQDVCPAGISTLTTLLNMNHK